MSDEKGIKPFWNKSSKEMSTKLWLPTKTVYQDLVMNYYNLYVQNLEQKSLQSKTQRTEMKKRNWQKISCLSSLSSQQDIMESVNINYARKIRIYPNKPQLDLFGKCFGVSRYIYNKGVECLNTCYKTKLEEFKNSEWCITCGKEKIEKSFFCKKHKNNKLKWDLPLTLPKLRPRVMKSDKDLSEEEKWQSDVPYDTRQLMLKSLIGNCKSCITNKKRGNIERFQLGFKSKKNPNQIFFNCKKSMKNFNIFKRRLKNSSKLKTRKGYLCYSNYTPKHDYSILKEGFKYYILLPKTRDTKFQKAPKETVSLDPGVRSFQTYYSPDGSCGKIEVGDNIKKCALKIDGLKSLITKAPLKRTRYNMKKRCSSLITKMKNIVKDLHWKACSFLVKNYQNIIIPHFQSKKMSAKENRNISKRTVRDMLGLSHFKFLEKLKYKCVEYQRNLHIVSEEYTSKTCGNCGTINDSLGSSKTFNCEKCSITIDRDINGARNILLKYLTGLDTTH